MALGFASQSRFVYSLRAAAPYGATALGLIYKMIDLKTIPCPMNAIPLLLVSALGRHRFRLMQCRITDSGQWSWKAGIPGLRR